MNQLNHVAIIMDGNGRWGIKYRNSRKAGHKEGLKTVERIIKESIKHKINHLTLFAFSTENWKRPKKEINFLFKLLEEFLKNKIDELIKEKIKIKFLGRRNFYPKLNKLIKETEKKTYKNKNIQINLALNYGSKEELINAFKLILKKKKKISEKNIK